ncbi:MAG: AzlD domain-containing protein [Pseudomonadota bacterium]
MWTVIGALAIGTYLIRYSFFGLIGGRELPEWALRHLRYTAVAVLPGLVAPAVIWPTATGGSPDLTRAAAAGAALLVGWWRKSPIWAIVAGFLTLYALSALH